MNKNKLFVIGLDSGTFDVIGPLIKDGYLQNLAKLIKAGCSGMLESTVPPVTPPAWVSFMTGKNPGKHGVFDFYASTVFGYERPVFNSKYVKARTLWSILSDLNKKVGVINVPMTFPPEKVNGFIIPGIQFGLDSRHEFSHPPELMQELTEKFGEYQVLYGNAIGEYSHELDNYVAQWAKIHNTREKVTLHLMDERPWDFFMAVFYSIDAIQHRFWKFFDKTHPLHNPKEAKMYGPVIPDFYQKIDDSIGKILDRLDDSTTVVVVSDHGMGAVHKGFYLNRWLRNEGFLKLKKGAHPFLGFRFPHIVYKVLRRLKYKGIDWTIPMNLYNILKDKVDPRDGLRLSYFVDWTKTRAYSANFTEQGLYINLKGREPMGIVEPGAEYERIREDLIGKLYQVVDPETGQKVFDKIYKKEEVYDGPYIEDAPDLFFVIKGGTYVSHKEIHYKELFRNEERDSGTHRMNGIFIIKGPGIKKDTKLEGCKITDVAPTILHSMGLSVPDDMDGKVLTDAFEAGFIKEHPVRYSSASGPDIGKDEGIYSDEDSEKIKEKLRGLGYIG